MARRSGKLFVFLLLLGASAAAPSARATPCDWTRITGNVRNDDGPVPYAKLAFVGEVWDSGCVATRMTGVETTADSVGRYEINVRAASGTLLFYNQDLDRYGGDKPVPLSLTPGAMTVDYRFHSPRVRCQVTGPDGTPASGTFYFDGCDPEWSFCADVSPRDFKDGAFDAYAPDGRVNVYASFDGLPGRPRLTRTFWVKNDTTVAMSYSGLVVRGELRRHGKPMEAAMVTASGAGAVASAWTDSLGAFALCVPAGSYRWMIEPEGAGSGTWYEIARDVDASARVRLDLARAKRKGPSTR